jgi:hypothetical protein
MRPFRLFLAYSFANEKVNDEGLPDQGISDLELADKVANWIQVLSHDQIEVVRTKDPFGNYLSHRIRQDICSSDGILCLFTKRTKDHLTGKWISSTYVISESSAAFMNLAGVEKASHRIYGLVEEGVDTEQLGMAFHRDRPAPRFQRSKLAELNSHVSRIVDAILDKGDRIQTLEPWEYLSLEKTATVWRSGAVVVETRHKFRFTKEMQSVQIPHTMWRVKNGLPPLEELLRETPDPRSHFLRVLPLHCGRHDPDNCRCEIIARPETKWGFERNFSVRFKDIRILPGDEIEYEILWGYPEAFHNDASQDKPNSVGLRTGGRGKAHFASLTLRFERDWAAEPFRTLEKPPKIFTTEVTDLPGAREPEEFFHDSEQWKMATELQPCRKRSCASMEVYSWSTHSFQGMAKAIWTPHANYFIEEHDSSVGKAAKTPPSV